MTLYILAAIFFILCNKNGGLWGHKGQPSLFLGPDFVLQGTLPWPNNTPDMALYILAIFLHSMQRKWDQTNSGDTKVDPLEPKVGLNSNQALNFNSYKLYTFVLREETLNLESIT